MTRFCSVGLWLCRRIGLRSWVWWQPFLIPSPGQDHAYDKAFRIAKDWLRLRWVHESSRSRCLACHIRSDVLSCLVTRRDLGDEWVSQLWCAKQLNRVHRPDLLSAAGVDRTTSRCFPSVCASSPLRSSSQQFMSELCLGDSSRWPPPGCLLLSGVLPSYIVTLVFSNYYL